MTGSREIDSTACDYDVIVLGSGAGGMAAALFSALHGLRACLIEKTDRFGGTTAWSGGMIWAPLSRVAAEAGLTDEDSEARVLRYLDALIDGASDDPRMLAYLRNAPRALDMLDASTSVKLQPVPLYPDYHSDLPGATTAGRVLEPVPFDAATLGPRLAQLRRPLPEFALLGTMMLARPDIPHFRKFGKSLKSTAVVLRQVTAFMRQKLRHGRGTRLVLGNALAARFLKSLDEAGVTLMARTEVTALCRDGTGRVNGVTLACGRTLRAARGIVLATGGITHDPERRVALLPPALADHSATCDAATGDGARLAEAMQSRIAEGAGGNAFYAPVSRYVRPDGSRATYPHTVVDRAKPGLIAVTPRGRRFVNEALSYHEFTKAMLRENPEPGSHAWLIADADFVWKYGLGAVKPMQVDKRRFMRQGYLLRARSIAALARRMGVPPETLDATVTAYNTVAQRGEDPAFHRGTTSYQRFLGDAEVAPNPCVAPITRAPFYAVRVLPGDLGAAAGIATDASARALDGAGRPVPGLYACGADACSIMQGHYPGPGITLGPAITFGFLAAHHMTCSHE